MDLSQKRVMLRGGGGSNIYRIVPHLQGIDKNIKVAQTVKEVELEFKGWRTLL